MIWIGVIAFAIGIFMLVAITVFSLLAPPDRSARTPRDRFIPGNYHGDGGIGDGG